MLLLLACGGGTQIADTPSPEAKVVARVEVEPSPTQESPKPEPTNPPIPKPNPTKAPATATATTKATDVPSPPTEVPPTATPTLTHTATLTLTPTPTQVPPTATPTQVPPTATPTQVPPADTPVFVLGGIRYLTCQWDGSSDPIKTFPDGSLNDSGDPSKKYECANDDGMSTTDQLQKMIDNGMSVEVVLRTAGDKPRVESPAVDYMKSIGLNRPKRDPVHYYLFSDNIPQDFIDQHTEIHDYLIDIVGGYDRYVHIIYELDGNNDSAIDTLNRIGLLNGNIESIDDVHEIRSCLTGFTAFDNWDGKNNWSLCIQPNPLTDPFWEHDREMFGLDKYRYGVFHGWIHEYFHHYQKSHNFDRAMAMPNDCCGLNDPVGAPAWWVEGAAIVFPDLFMNEYFYVLNYTNTNQFKFSDGGYPFRIRRYDGEARNQWWDQHFKETRKLMRSTGHSGCTGAGPDEEYRDTAKCDWFLMNVYLAYITSYQTLFVNLSEDMWELGFDGSFEKHVGMTKEEFYESFNAFMREGDPDDPSPTGFFPDKPISELVDFWSINSG